MKTQHTPGPWTINPHTQPMGSNAVSQIVETAFGGIPICRVTGLPNGMGPEEIANARLIASAPELLSALETLMEFWNNGTPVHPGAEVVQDARLVLAKVGK